LRTLQIRGRVEIACGAVQITLTLDDLLYEDTRLLMG
jgi:hypothetical protein